MPNGKFGLIIPTMNMQLFIEETVMKKIFILLQLEFL